MDFSLLLEARSRLYHYFRPNRAPTLRVPLEIVRHIIGFASTPSGSTAPLPLDCTSIQPRVHSKPGFDMLRGLSGASRAMRAEVLSVWFRTLHIREPADWKKASQMGVCNYVLEIRVLAQGLDASVPNNVFMQFKHLHTALIDSHNDFIPHIHIPGEPPQPVGRYRLVAPQLPRNLHRLWLTNAHGPDARVIQNLRAQCPGLKELWIERCTTFSPRMIEAETINEQHEAPPNEVGRAGARSGCAFWDLFPNDHDAYFAALGVEDYARSLATELGPLASLEQLHMGLYLTPHEALASHKAHHREQRIQTPLWGPVCQTCSEEFGPATRAAEEQATMVLARALPSLKAISWSSYFSADKAGRSTYQMVRKEHKEVVCECRDGELIPDCHQS